VTETATALLALSCMLLPGFAIARWGAPRVPALTRWGLGATLGLALLVIRATALHASSVLTAGWIPAMEASLVALSLAALTWGSTGARRLPAELRSRRAMLSLVAIVGLGALLRLGLHHGAAIALNNYDSPAHATLSLALWLNPGEATWAPFMDAQPHYPWGAHTMVGLIHAVSGVSIHGVLTVMTSAGLGAITIVILAGLARCVWDADAPALGAAFLAAVCGRGLLLVAQWGGYPSEVGFALVAGIALALLVASSAPRVGALALPLSTLALLWSHHLTAAIGAAAIGVPFVAIVLGEPASRRGAGRAMIAVLLAAAMAAPMWSVVLDVELAGDTAALSIPRHLDLVSSLPNSVGAWVLVFVAIALASSTVPKGRGRLAVLGAIAGLAIGFTICLPLAKLATISDGARGILVPSRWLGALAFPLIVLGGGGVAFAWRTWPRWRVAAAIGLTAGALVTVWGARGMELDPAAWGAHVRAGEIVGEGGVVLSHTRDQRWAGFASHRTANAVPAPPGSDPLTERARALDTQLLPALSGQPKPPWIEGTTAVVVDLRERAPARSPYLRPVERHGPHGLFTWHAAGDAAATVGGRAP
jgi:hypothetical protein